MAWFQHDTHALQDIKCQRLLARWGNEGYGAWWRLCEMLANTTGHALTVDCDEVWEIVAAQIGMLGTPDDGFSGAEKCKRFVGDLLEIGLLIEGQNHSILSKRMLKNAQFFGAQRANGSKGGRPRKDAKAGENSRSEAV